MASPILFGVGISVGLLLEIAKRRKTGEAGAVVESGPMTVWFAMIGSVAGLILGMWLRPTIGRWAAIVLFVSPWIVGLWWMVRVETRRCAVERSLAPDGGRRAARTRRDILALLLPAVPYLVLRET